MSHCLCGFFLSQKISFKANCMMRASRAVVMVPNCEGVLAIGTWRKRVVYQSKVDVVWEVKRFDTKLQPKSLRDLRVFDERRVEVHSAGMAHVWNRAARVSEGEIWRINKLGSVKPALCASLVTRQLGALSR